MIIFEGKVEINSNFSSKIQFSNDESFKISHQKYKKNSLRCSYKELNGKTFSLIIQIFLHQFLSFFCFFFEEVRFYDKNSRFSDSLKRILNYFKEKPFVYFISKIYGVSIYFFSNYHGRTREHNFICNSNGFVSDINTRLKSFTPKKVMFK